METFSIVERQNKNEARKNSQDIAFCCRAVLPIILDALEHRETRDLQKYGAFEGSGGPIDKKLEIQKLGTEPQGQIVGKVQIKFAGNFGTSYKKFGDIETSKVPSRVETSR